MTTAPLPDSRYTLYSTPLHRATPPASPSPSSSSSNARTSPSSPFPPSPKALSRFVQLLTGSSGADEMNSRQDKHRRERSRTLPSRKESSAYVQEGGDGKGGRGWSKVGSSSTSKTSVRTSGLGSEGGGIGESPARSRSSTLTSTPPSTLFVKTHHAQSSSLTRTFSTVSSSSSEYLKDRPTSEDTKGSVRGRGQPAMLDPRFTFPVKRASGGGVGLGIAPSGQSSFVASLGLAPLVDDSGHYLPLYPTAESQRHAFQPPPSADPTIRGSLLSAFSPHPRPSLPNPSTTRTPRPSASSPNLRSSAQLDPSPPPVPSPTSPYVVPLGLCELYSFPRPRLVPVSPPGSPLVDPSPRRKGKEKALPSLPAWVDDDDDGASVRRVLRENKESQLERALWNEEGRKRGKRGRSESAKRGYESDGGVGIGSVGKRREERRRAREGSTVKKEEDEVERLRSVPVGEGGRMGAAWVRDVEPKASPPTALSFDPFTNIVGHIRKLSISRSRERRIGASGVSAIGQAPPPPHLKPLIGSRKRSASDAQVLQQPKLVGNTPIRHVRGDSVDSLYPRPNASTRRMAVGTALSGTQTTSSEPVATRQSQNAFLSLPPHLHHLLRQPTSPGPDTSFIPSRPPPPIPSAPGFSSARAREQRDSGASAESDAALIIALDLKLRTEDERARGESTPTSNSSTTIAVAVATTPLRPQGSFDRSLPTPPRRRKTPPSHGESNSTLRHRRLGEATELLPWDGSPRFSHDPTATPTLGGNGDGIGAYFDRPLTTTESPVARSPFFRPAPSSEESQAESSHGARASPPMQSPLSRVSHQSHDSEGQRSILNLDEEGSNFQDLRARAQRISASTIVSTEEGTPLPSDSTHKMSFGEVSRAPVIFEERHFSRLSHQADQFARAPDSRRTTDVLDTPRAAELDKLFAHTIEHVAGVEMGEFGGGDERTRPSTTDSGAESEAWATAEDGGSMSEYELPEVNVGSTGFGEQQFDLPRHLAPALAERPRPSPTQGSWAATSFGREYFGAEDDYDGSNVVPRSRSLSREHVAAEEPEDYDGSNVVPIPRGSNAPTPRSADSGRSSFLDFTRTGTPPNDLHSTSPLKTPDGPRGSSARSSFLDFEGPQDDGHSSQGSFLDWSPSNSPIRPAPSAFRIVDFDNVDSASHSFLRHPRRPSLEDPNRDSYLSVNSFTRPSPKADHLSGNERSSYGSSPGSRVSGMSNVSLGSNFSHLVADFPDPPTQVHGGLDEGDEDEEETRRFDRSVEDDPLRTMHSTSTLRPHRTRSMPSLSQSTISLTNTSDWTVESISVEDGVRRLAPDDEEALELDLARGDFAFTTQSSFLDLSSSPERYSIHARRSTISRHSVLTTSSHRRPWSGSSFLTFFSGARTHELGQEEEMPRREERRHVRTSSDPMSVRRGWESPEERGAR